MNSLDHVDLNLLRVFQAIVEERSLTRAGMQPTPIALELSGIVARALDTVREALRYAEHFDPAASTRTFRLSLSDAGELAYLPPICEALHQQAPRVKLSIEPLPVEAIEDALRASRLDFAIGNLPTLTARTRHQLLFEETYVCMTRKRRGLPRTKELSMKAFVDASHVQITSVEHSHYALDDAFRAQGVGRHIALELPHFVALPSVLAVTDLFATLPRRLAQIFNRDGGFQLYELPVTLPMAAVTMHWHEHFDQDEGNVWLRNLMGDIVRRFDER